MAWSNFKQSIGAFVIFTCLSHISSSLSLDLHRQIVQDWATCRRSSASRRASSTPCGSTCCPTTPTTPYSFPSCCRNWPTCGSWWRSTRSWSRRSTRRRTLHSTRFCRRSTGTCTDFEPSPFSASARTQELLLRVGQEVKDAQLRGGRSPVETSLYVCTCCGIKLCWDIIG